MPYPAQSIRNARLVAAYLGGKSINELAARFRISKQRVSQILAASGVKPRHAGGRKRMV